MNSITMILSALFASDIKSVPTPEAIVRGLNAVVIGQTNVKVALSVAVYNHYKRLSYNHSDSNAAVKGKIHKSNIMILGPSGSGKTLLVETLAKIIDVPFAVADATTLTETGWAGADVDSVLTKLYYSAEKDVERCQRGIVYLDEIDKLRKSSVGHRDIKPDLSSIKLIFSCSPV
jgi:ATP-dependent Clp protease ATP-binding subunit ClpX